MKNVKHAKTSKAKKRWVAGVTTDSTHPQAGLFTKKCSCHRQRPVDELSQW